MRTPLLLPVPKPLPARVITAAHRAAELLVKFKDSAPAQLVQQVRTSWSTEPSQPLPGHSTLERLSLKSGVSVAQAVADLQQLTAVVEWVEPNYLVKTQTRGRGKNERRSAGARAGQRLHSSAPLVAVIDTGIAASHPRLRAHRVAGWNVLRDTADTNDDNGHGTQMAGIIARVHRQARILPLKALDGEGIGAVSAVIAAMDQAVAEHAQVILYSFGTEGKSQGLLEAIQRAEKSGVVVVTAAGNDGQDLANAPQYPAAFTAPNLLTVAASNSNGELADFSNYGQSAQVAAPGVEVKTTTPAHAFTRISGTSASAAYVAGIASRLKAVRPWVSAPTILQSITRSAQKRPSFEGKVSAGLVDANAALIELQNPKPTDKPKEEKAPINKKLEERKKNFKTRKASKELPDPEMPRTFAHNLDNTRENRPSLPEARVKVNARQGAGYDDPVPTSTANFAAYFTELTKANNDTGIAGSKPLQQVDPTVGVSAIGGLSHNLLSRNLNFTAPVLSLAGRGGLNLGLGLSYNSNVWTKNPGTNTMFYNAERGFPAPGWRLGFGAIQGVNNSGSVGPYTNSITGKASFLYIQPDGTKRDLAYNATSGKYESYDSSYLDFDASTKILRTTSGTQITFGVSATASGDYQFLPTQIKDRNGNFLTIVYKQLSNNDTVLDYVIDTLGRRIDFYYQNNRLTEIRQDRNGTIFKYAVIDYTPITLSASFSSVPNQDVSGTTVYVPSRITYPTGINLRVSYNGYGQVTAVNKWVPTISGQGSERQIATSSLTLSSSPADASPTLNSRTETGENWGGSVFSYVYTNSNAAAGCSSCPTATVTEPAINGNPSGSTHTITNHGLTQSTFIRGPGYDQYGYPTTITYKTTGTTYVSDSGVSYPSNVRPIQSGVTDQSGQSRKIGVSYLQQNGIWLVQHKDDFAANGTTVYRRTTMTYTGYPAQRILGLPLTSSIYAGPGTTLLAKSENIYDQTATYQDSNSQTVNYFLNAGATVQHDDANYGSIFTSRGNLTTVKQYATDGTTNRIVGRTSYDTNGIVRHVADAAGNRQSMDLTDNFTNKPAGLGALQAYPSLTSDPIGMKAGAQYNYYTGQVVKTFAQRPNQSTEEQVTTTTYDFADRPLRTTAPTGSYVELGYWDNLLRQTTYTKRDVVNGVDQLVYSWQDFDGMGQVMRKGSDHPNGGAGKFSGQKFKYDALGRGIEQSNVLAVTSSFVIDTTEPGQPNGTDWKWTAAEFDGLGRTTAVEKPDNTYLFTDYSVCGCAGGLVTDNYDERNNRKTTENDFLGRLQYAREYAPYYSYDGNGQPYISDYSLHAEVEYQYDGLDRLTTIIHRTGNGAISAGKLTGPGQTRSFAYDIWGRAQSETTPEAGTVSYSYTTNDQVQTTTNANGKITTVAYNNRNLVTGISYNDTTPAVSYGYDDYGARTAMTDGEGAMSFVYDGFRRLQTETRTFSGLAGKSYKYSYDFNLGGQLKQADYTALNSGSRNVPPSPASPVRSEVVSTGGALPAPFDKLGRGLSYSPTLTSLLPARKGLTRETRWQARIVGYVKRPAAQGGQPIAGATVNCQQTTSENMNHFDYIHVTATTNSAGYYACEFLSNGPYVNYSVSATAPGWQVSPSSQAVYVWGETDFPADFTATPTSSTTTLSGVITSPGGQTLSGVTVTLTGSMNQTTTSNSSGQYSFPVNTLGTYTVQPSKTGYTFAPTSLNLGGFVQPQTANFQALLGSPPPPNPPTGAFFHQTINYQYKASGALHSIGSSLLGGSAQDNIWEGVQYTAFGAAAQIHAGNNRKTMLFYDQSLMRLSGIHVARPNGTDKIVHHQYGYTENGLIANAMNYADTNYSANYEYNFRNQLVKYLGIGNNGYNTTRTYNLDDFGNLTSIWNHPYAENTTYTYAGGNRLSSVSVSWPGSVTNFTYDNAGNMTAAGSTTYAWDAANRLKNVNGGALGSYGYDANGKRVKKSESGTTTYYVISSVLGSAMEVTSAGVQRAYVMNGGSVVAQRNPNGQFYWLHLDHLGSGRKMTDSTGAMTYRAEFDPYGKLLYEWSSPTNLNTRKFTGYERDAASGLDYAQARMYSSDWGRFMSPDPMGLGAARLKSPKSLNRYSYVEGNPINYKDSGGTCTYLWVEDGYWDAVWDDFGEYKTWVATGGHYIEVGNCDDQDAIDVGGDDGDSGDGGDGGETVGEQYPDDMLRDSIHKNFVTAAKLDGCLRQLLGEETYKKLGDITKHLPGIDYSLTGLQIGAQFNIRDKDGKVQGVYAVVGGDETELMYIAKERMHDPLEWMIGTRYTNRSPLQNAYIHELGNIIANRVKKNFGIIGEPDEDAGYQLQLCMYGN